VKESLVALRLKLAVGITMLLLCGVARADSVPIPCTYSFCAGDTDTVTLTSQPPAVIGLSSADTIISFNFQMVDTEAVDMNGFTFLTGPAGSGISVGFYPDGDCASPGSAYNNTIPPGETFDCGLSVDIGNEFTATPGIYTWGLALLDWALPPGGLVIWTPQFTTDVLAPATLVDEPSTRLLLIPSLLALVALKLKRATA
jgi:hypothetical protein